MTTEPATGLSRMAIEFLAENPDYVPVEWLESGEPLFPYDVLKRYGVWLVGNAAAPFEFGINVAIVVENCFKDVGVGSLSLIDEHYVSVMLAE